MTMLEQIMQEIRAGGTIETADLAARLGTTSQMVEAMLEHLQRNGLIQDYSGCSDGCQGCSLQDSCKKPGIHTVRLWQSQTHD